jgi:hypothetical protein
MRTFRKFFGGVVLTLTLTPFTFAGQIDLPKPNPATSPSSVTTNGDISTGVTGQIEIPSAAGDIHTTAPASDSVFEAALNLVRGVLSLF